MTLQRHLVSVWNPSYTSIDAMEAHLAILLRFAEERRRGNAYHGDVIVSKLGCGSRTLVTISRLRCVLRRLAVSQAAATPKAPRAGAS